MTFSIRAVFAAIALAGATAASFTVGALPARAQAAANQPTRIAVLNSRVILADAPGRAAAEAALERELTALRAEIQRMGDSLQTMVRDYEAREAMLSPPARETQRRAIQDRQVQFEARRDSLSMRADRRQVELMQPILDLVNKVIQDVRDESAYTLILDIGGEAHGIVAYDKNLDITERIVARVRREPAPGTGRGGQEQSPAAADEGRAPPVR